MDILDRRFDDLLQFYLDKYSNIFFFGFTFKMAKIFKTHTLLHKSLT